MKSIEKVKQWLIKNRKDEFGNLDLSYLDFSDFNGDIFINHMKVKKGLFQNEQTVGGDLLQNCQKVEGNLWQYSQKVGEDLWQYNQEVNGDVWQHNQKVKGYLLQKNQQVSGALYSHKLNDDEYWEPKKGYTIRQKRLQKITRKQLAEMGYELYELEEE